MQQENRFLGATMRMDEVESVLEALARDRPLFHSEADFQHSLAWALQTSEPERKIRLEYRAPIDEVMHVDILLVEPSGLRLAFELKYWTRRLEVSVIDEAFALRNHGAHDVSRYDFVKDITRVERLIDVGVVDAGCVIAVTNDAGYWSSATRPDTIDAAFRLPDGRVLEGDLAWAEHAGAGTTRGRLLAHGLSGRYTLAWADYSDVADGPSGAFRHLAVWVEGTPRIPCGRPSAAQRDAGATTRPGPRLPRRMEGATVSEPRKRRGKYGPLQQHLAGLTASSVSMSFSEVAELVGGLPASASNHRAWWSNESGDRPTQARAWMDAGWRVAEVNLTAERVRFVSS